MRYFVRERSIGKHITLHVDGGLLGGIDLGVSIYHNDYTEVGWGHEIEIGVRLVLFSTSVTIAWGRTRS